MGIFDNISQILGSYSSSQRRTSEGRRQTAKEKGPLANAGRRLAHLSPLRNKDSFVPRQQVTRDNSKSVLGKLHAFGKSSKAEAVANFDFGGLVSDAFRA